MQWEGGAFSLLAGFGGCGIIVEGRKIGVGGGLYDGLME